MYKDLEDEIDEVFFIITDPHDVIKEKMDMSINYFKENEQGNNYLVNQKCENGIWEKGQYCRITKVNIPPSPPSLKIFIYLIIS